MKVFIVEHGEKHEGGEICGVFKNKEKAIACALGIRTCFEGGWVPTERPFYWENECDYVKVSEWEVK